MEKKYIKALDVKDFGHDLYVGDEIKIYGEETTITGFSASYNDGIEKWETIIYTIGRGDPLERSLGVIEILVDRPRTFKERSPFYAAQQAPTGAVWIKSSERFPVMKHVVAKMFVSHLNKEIVGIASSTSGEMICFDWSVSSICLAIGHEELVNLKWLDESATNPDELWDEFSEATDNGIVMTKEGWRKVWGS